MEQHKGGGEKRIMLPGDPAGGSHATKTQDQPIPAPRRQPPPHPSNFGNNGRTSIPTILQRLQKPKEPSPHDDANKKVQDRFKYVQRGEMEMRRAGDQEKNRRRFQDSHQTLNKEANLSKKDIAEGWQTVKRRRRGTGQRNNYESNKGEPRKTTRYTKFNMNKCFRCLSADHKVAQCREPIRCHKCYNLGHYSYRCNIKKPPTPQPKPTPNTHFTNPTTTYAQAVNQPKEMNGELYDEDLEPFWDERPEEEEVFLPPHEALRPVNMYLERSAWIGLQIGVYSPAFLEAVKRTLSHIHGGTASSYRIEKVSRNKYLLIFRDQQMRDIAVQERPYAIPALGAQFTLFSWKPTDGFQYNPPRYETWVRLIDVPLHMWNDEEITRLTVKLGTIKSIMAYGLNVRQLEHITIHMATRHPRHIPKWLRVRMGDYGKRVRVKLLAWSEEPAPAFPPPPSQPEQRQQPARRPQQQHRRPPSPNIHSYSGESSADSNAHPWAHSGGHYISQANLMKHKAKKIWIPKPNGMNMKPSNKGKAKIGEPAEVLRHEGKENRGEGNMHEPLRLLSRYDDNNTTARKIAKLVQVMLQPNNDEKELRPTMENSLMKKKTQAATPKVSRDMAITVHIGSVVAARLLMQPEFTSLARLFDIKCFGSTLPNGGPYNSSNRGLEFKVQKKAVSVLNVEGMEGTETQDRMDNSWIEGNGIISNFFLSQAAGPSAPPGFETDPASTGFEIDQAHSGNEADLASAGLEIEQDHSGNEANQAQPFEARRSPRIKRKLNGPYIPMLKRAQKVLGYEETQPTKKKSTKAKAAGKAKAEYTHKLDPLSETHAELVLAAAGVEMEENIKTLVLKEMEIEDAAATVNSTGLEEGENTIPAEN